MSGKPSQNDTSASPTDDLATKSAQPPSQVTAVDGQSATPTIAESTIDIGCVLGPYRLVEKLGEGGMGAVYRARHEHLEKDVAVKILPHQVTSHPEHIARFKREMKAIGQLTHPNIVQAYDAGVVENTHYLAMEYVEGVDLQKFVKQHGPLSVAEACRLVRQAALALESAHEAGLVHRDIKPSNLLLAKNGQLKLLDLGLARLEEDAGLLTAMTQAGQTIGTPDFMAPEQWDDAHSADARSDLYSLGCTLYFLLTGRPPFAAESYRSMANKMKGHLHDPAPDLRSTGCEIPDGVAAICSKLLCKSPNDRFQSATELADALRSVVSGADSQLTPQTVAGLTSVIPTPLRGGSAKDVPPSTTQLPGAAIRRRLRHFTVAAILICLSAGLIWPVVFPTLDPNGSKAPPTVDDQSMTPVAGSAGSTELLQPSQDSVTVQSTWNGWPADAPPPAIAPFDSVQARRHQEAWAAYLKLPVEYVNSLGMRFRLIPPGEFTMGSSPEEIDEALLRVDQPEKYYWHVRIQSEAPQHKVTLTQPFYLGTFEVTQSEYQSVMGTNPAHFAATGAGQEFVDGMETATHPVETVSWDDAADFCIRLSEREGLSTAYARADESVVQSTGIGYRLPTEAEWECACRAGTTTRFWSGDLKENLNAAGWNGRTSEDRSHAAGELQPNPYGLHDIHGNIGEWVEDSWEPTFYEKCKGNPAPDPCSLFGANSFRVVRGGNLVESWLLCRSSSRFAEHDDYPSRYIGFRVKLPFTAVRQATLGQ